MRFSQLRALARGGPLGGFVYSLSRLVAYNASEVRVSINGIPCENWQTVEFTPVSPTAFKGLPEFIAAIGSPATVQPSGDINK